MPPAYLRAPGVFPAPLQFCKKSGYATRRQAAQALKHLSLCGSDGMRAYRCKICPGDMWHLGHPGETYVHRLVRAKRMAHRTEES